MDEDSAEWRNNKKIILRMLIRLRCHRAVSSEVKDLVHSVPNTALIWSVSATGVFLLFSVMEMLWKYSGDKIQSELMKLFRKAGQVWKCSPCAVSLDGHI